MSQNDDQNRDPQDQREGYQDANHEQTPREGRGDSQSNSQQDQSRRSPLDDIMADDVDELDEDRDDDQREGGDNRRRSIS